jgi:16S rRNA pseudouridine516 synthase
MRIISSGPVSTAEITIQEGKYHQVKRMVGALGMRVSYLRRVRMGPLHLDQSLEPGQYRELTEEEISLLLDR